MNFLVLDVETSTKNEGNPFTPENKLCLVAYATPTESGWFKIDKDDEPYGKQIAVIQRLIDECDIIVGHNIKFDLLWLRRYGNNFDGKRIWDTQLVEYMLANQEWSYPSLDDSLGRRNLGAKSRVVHDDYWAKGIDTPDIPIEILSEYGQKDAELERALYISQFEDVSNRPRAFRNLVNLSNADLLVTTEMQWNGLLLDVDRCRVESVKIEEEVRGVDLELQDRVGHDWINWNSPAQLSVVLYGGKLTQTWREQVGVFKTGQKLGLPRFAIRTKEHEFRRLVEPIKGSGLVNGGFSTSEDVLHSLDTKNRKVRELIDLILRRNKLQKLRGTYYDGLPDLLSTMGWTGNYLHGQINHAISRTGRTSSSKPNLQNMPPEIDVLFRSRFDGGQVVSFDAKGLEWVAVVYESQDPVGMQEVREGVDQHARNQEAFNLPEKRVAKFFVFRIIYGGTAYTFTVDPDFNWISRSESFWQKVVDTFEEKYRGIPKVHGDWIREVSETGGYVTSSGRVFRFDGDISSNRVQAVIKNYRIQSLGHDLMAIARVSLYKRLKTGGYKSLLINTVHDSKWLDIFPGEWYNIKRLVEEVFADIPKNFEKLFGKEFNLPLRVEAKRLDGEEIIE